MHIRKWISEKLVGDLSARTQLVALFAFVSVVLSLWVRISYRGPYYAGWEAVGQAQGLYLLSTLSLWDAVRTVFDASIHGIWTPVSSLIYTLIPGALAMVLPWEYWGHVLNVLFFGVTLWVILRAAELPFNRFWLLLLAAGTSPAILSYAVSGYPYVTGFLPHVLVLYLVLNERLRERWLATLLWGSLVLFSSWHFAEMGKTCFVAFILGAFLIRGVPWHTRLTWLFLGVAQAVLMSKFANNPTQFFLSQINTQDWSELGTRLFHVFDALFISRMLDIPVLSILGVASFWFFRRHRVLILLLLLGQLAFVLMLAMSEPSFIRPRRYLIVDFYCLLAIAFALRESDFLSRLGMQRGFPLLWLLIAGNVWQWANMLNFMQTPVQKQAHTLPYLYSQADWTVMPGLVDWTQEAKARIHRGERLLVLYNFSSYPENSTSPEATLERLYSALGHQRFVDSVHVFASRPVFSVPNCRYDCLPMHPMEALDAFLDQLEGSSPSELARVSLYYPQSQSSWSPYGRSENRYLFDQIRRRFALRVQESSDSEFIRFSIHKKAKANSASPDVVVEAGASYYEHKVDGRIERRPFIWQGLPLEMQWVDASPMEQGRFPAIRPWPGEMYLKATGVLHVLRDGHYDLLLGARDVATFKLGERVALEVPEPGRFRIVQGGMDLKRGSYPFEIEFFSDGSPDAHLLVDLTRSEGVAQVAMQAPIWETVPMSTLLAPGYKATYYPASSGQGTGVPAGAEVHTDERLHGEWKSFGYGLKRPFPGVFSMYLEGQLQIRQPGVYRLNFGSAERGTVYLGDTLVLENGPGKNGRSSGLFYLKPGLVPMRLDIEDQAGNAGFQLTAQRCTNCAP